MLLQSRQRLLETRPVGRDWRKAVANLYQQHFQAMSVETFIFLSMRGEQLGATTMDVTALGRQLVNSARTFCASGIVSLFPGTLQVQENVQISYKITSAMVSHSALRQCPQCECVAAGSFVQF